MMLAVCIYARYNKKSHCTSESSVSQVRCIGVKTDYRCLASRIQKWILKTFCIITFYHHPKWKMWEYGCTSKTLAWQVVFLCVVFFHNIFFWVSNHWTMNASWPYHAWFNFLCLVINANLVKFVIPRKDIYFLSLSFKLTILKNQMDNLIFSTIQDLISRPIGNSHQKKGSLAYEKSAIIVGYFGRCW
jgi:hypothetical protein